MELPLLLSRPLKIVGLFCAMSVGGCDKESAVPKQPQATEITQAATPAAPGVLDRSHKGQPIPAFTVSDAAGKKLDLSSLKGKPVLVNLWATWCAPCVAELPTLDRLSAIKGDRLHVITVSQDMKTDKVAAFLKDKGGEHLPAWLDPNTELSFKFQVQTLPTTILYDAGGKELWRFVGGQEWDRGDAGKLLLEAGVN